MNTVGWSEDFDTNEEVNVGPYMEWLQVLTLVCTCDQTLPIGEFTCVTTHNVSDGDMKSGITTRKQPESDQVDTTDTDWTWTEKLLDPWAAWRTNRRIDIRCSYCVHLIRHWRDLLGLQGDINRKNGAYWDATVDTWSGNITSRYQRPEEEREMATTMVENRRHGPWLVSAVQVVSLWTTMEEISVGDVWLRGIQRFTLFKGLLEVLTAPKWLKTAYRNRQAVCISAWHFSRWLLKSWYKLHGGGSTIVG